MRALRKWVVLLICVSSVCHCLASTRLIFQPAACPRQLRSLLNKLLIPVLVQDIPVGMPVHNVELVPGKGGQICRSAGCMATIVNKQTDHAIVRLPSGG